MCKQEISSHYHEIDSQLIVTVNQSLAFEQIKDPASFITLIVN